MVCWGNFPALKPMNPTLLRAIFTPTPSKLLLTVLLAVFAHYLLVADAVRQTAGAEVVGAREFWLTGFFSALPFLETDNIVLKFLTFFVLIYGLIWLVSRAFGTLDALQVRIIKKLRKSS